MKQPVLFPERLVGLSGMCLGGLVLHVCVCDLGEFDQVKDDGEDEDEDGDGRVYPLDVLKGDFLIEDEKDIRAEDGGNDGADAIEGLSDVDSDFGVAGWPAHGDIGVSGRLERAQAVANDKDADAEPGEGVGFDARDREKGAEAIEEEAPDEDGSVTKSAKDPGGVAEGGKRVGTGKKERLAMITAVSNRKTYPK